MRIFCFKNKFILIWVMILLLALLNSCDRKSVVYDKFDLRPLELGELSSGIFDTDTGDIIDYGAYYKVSNDKGRFTCRLTQNLLGLEDYMILAFLDYKQIEFTVDDKIYTSYKVTLDGEERIIFDIDIDFNGKDNYELLNFVVFRNADFLPENIDFDNKSKNNDFVEWQNSYLAFSTRIMLTDTLTPNNIPYEEDIILESDLPSSHIMLTYEDYNELKAVPTAKSGESLSLLITNNDNYTQDFMAVALLGWEQCKLNEEDDMKLFKVEEESTAVYKLNLPKVNEALPYYVILFPEPFYNFNNDKGEPAENSQFREYSTLKLLIN